MLERRKFFFPPWKMRESGIRLIRQSKNSFREKKKIKFEEKKKSIREFYSFFVSKKSN